MSRAILPSVPTSSARMVAVKYFPVFFDLKGLRVLVVGGGDVALRKVSLLESTGAVITVVAPRVAPPLTERGAAGTIKLVLREFVPEDLDGARLVIVATSHRAVNRSGGDAAEEGLVAFGADAAEAAFVFDVFVDQAAEDFFGLAQLVFRPAQIALRLAQVVFRLAQIVFGLTQVVCRLA